MKITGKHLIQMGYRQGRWFKTALEYVNRHRLIGDELRSYLDTQAPHVMDLHSTAVPFHRNIVAETPEESSNVEAVINTMYALMRTPTIVGGALMPDACPTGSIGQIPVGGIVVAKDAIHPAMHSADICCSVMMTSFGICNPKSVLDSAHRVTHFGPGGRIGDPFSLPAEMEDRMKGNYFTKSRETIQLAKSHLGTQGDGNHFLYVGQSEKTGETIMVTHHGSRGLGANIYKQGSDAAEKYRREISPQTLKMNAWIPYSEAQGKDYWEALQLVREWTKLNHTLIHQSTCLSLGVDPQQRFWNEHNFVFKDEDKFYHAKGATPLDDRFVPDSEDGLRLIPLNMSEPILIVKGATSETNLGFAPHGAGRDISRTQHRLKFGNRSEEDIFRQETAGLDVRFYSGEIDISELPSAYKNAENVQSQMKKFGLGTVVDRILPYGCIMAGDWQKGTPWRRKKNK